SQFKVGDQVQLTPCQPIGSGSAAVSLLVKTRTGGNHLVTSSVVAVASGVCAGSDSQPPTVAGWGTTALDGLGAPRPDVDNITVGQVNVTASLVDDCAGPNDQQPPHLWYRLGTTTTCPGTGNYTDNGPMAHV